MHGIRGAPPKTPHLALDKLDALKADTKKLEQMQTRVTELEKFVNDLITKIEAKLDAKACELESRMNNRLSKFDDDRNKLSMLEQRIDENDIQMYGNGNDVNGFVDEIRSSLEGMREEYIDLIGRYIQNATPRGDTAKLQDIEERLKKLEEKPKLIVSDKLEKIKINGK
jgi:actin-like ATPase involved in cell morphogenesis